VKVEVNKIDDANIAVKSNIENSVIEANVNRLAKEAGKQMKVDGFRKGKVPPAVVKKLYGDKLRQDAEADSLKTLIDMGLEQAGVNASDLIGEPIFKKYEKNDDGIAVEMVLSLRPDVDTKGYEEAIPSFEKPEVSDEEVEEKLKEIAEQYGQMQKIKRKRMVREGDTAIIDFEGFLDGEPFEGGKAEKYPLKIGSGSFIPGFEEQIVGMKYDEEKSIKVTFPEDYQAENLAGKEVEFKVKMHEIQEKVPAEIDDELAKKVLQKEDATLDELKEQLKKQIENEKIGKLYREELKPKIIEALVEKLDFALPQNIVEQEIDVKVNEKAREMSEEELNSYKENPEKVEKLREEVREEAEKSVKATFIVDALAKEHGISVDDQEVSNVIYYEALMSGQDPQAVLKYYQENNLLPAIKMGMIEDKLFAKLLGLEG
jgi:trigger factor